MLKVYSKWKKMFNEYNAILKGNELCFIVNLLPVIINSNVFLEKA